LFFKQFSAPLALFFLILEQKSFSMLLKTISRYQISECNYFHCNYQQLQIRMAIVLFYSL